MQGIMATRDITQFWFFAASMRKAMYLFKASVSGVAKTTESLMPRPFGGVVVHVLRRSFP